MKLLYETMPLNLVDYNEGHRSVARHAAIGGHWTFLEYYLELLDTQKSRTDDFMWHKSMLFKPIEIAKVACSNGHKRILKGLMDMKFIKPTMAGMHELAWTAAKTDHPEILDFLKKKYFPMGQEKKKYSTWYRLKCSETGTELVLEPGHVAELAHFACQRHSVSVVTWLEKQIGHPFELDCSYQECDSEYPFFLMGLRTEPRGDDGERKKTEFLKHWIDTVTLFRVMSYLEVKIDGIWNRPNDFDLHLLFKAHDSEAILKWLSDYDVQQFSSQDSPQALIHHLSKHGLSKVLQEMLNAGQIKQMASWTSMVTAAAHFGNLDILELAWNNLDKVVVNVDTFEMTLPVIRAGIYYQHTEIVDFACKKISHTAGDPRWEDVARHAISNTNTEALQYLVDNGFCKVDLVRWKTEYNDRACSCPRLLAYLDALVARS